MNCNRVSTSDATDARNAGKRFPADARKQLCKKVIQLTRVVHRLATRDASYSEELRAMQKAYEQQNQYIVRDCFRKVAFLRRQLDKERGMNGNSTEARAEAEKAAFQLRQLTEKWKHEVESVKASAVTKLNTIQETSQREVGAIKQQLQDERQQFEERIECIQNELTAQAEKQIQSLKESHKTAIDRLHNSHAQVLRQEQQRIEDERSQLREQLEALGNKHSEHIEHHNQLSQALLRTERRIAQLQQEAVDLRRERDEALASTQAVGEQLRAAFDNHRRDQDSMRQQSEVLEKRLRQSEQQCSDLKSECTQQSEQLSKAHRENAEIRASMKQSTREKEQLRYQIRELTQAQAELQDALHNAKCHSQDTIQRETDEKHILAQELARLQQQHADLKSSAEAASKHADRQKALLEQALVGAEQRIAQHEATITEQRCSAERTASSGAELTRRTEAAENALSSLQRQYDRATGEHEANLLELQSVVTAMKDKLLEASKTQESLQSELQTQRQKHNAEIRKISQDTDAKVREIKTQHGNAIQRQKETMNEQLRKLENEFAEQQSALKENHADEIAKLQREIKETQNALEAVQEQLLQSSQQLTNSEQLSSKRHLRLVELEAKLKRQAASHEKEVVALKTHFDAQLRHSLESLKKQCQEQADRELDMCTETARLEYDKLSLKLSQADAKNDSLQEQLRDAKSESEALQARLVYEKQEADRVLQKQIQEMQNESASAQIQFQLESDRLKQQLALTVEEQRRECEDAKMQLQRQRNRLLGEQAQLKQQLEKKLEDTVLELTKAHEKQRDEATRESAEVQRIALEEAAKTARQHEFDSVNRARFAVLSQLAAKEAEVQNLQAKATKLHNSLNQSHQRSTELHERLEQLAQQHVDEVRQLKALHVIDLTDEKALSKQRLHEVRQLADEQLALERQAFRDLSKRFDSRPSREEDVSKIEELSSQNTRLQSQLNAALHNVQQLRLHLQQEDRLMSSAFGGHGAPSTRVFRPPRKRSSSKRRNNANHVGEQLTVQLQAPHAQAASTESGASHSDSKTSKVNMRRLSAHISASVQAQHPPIRHTNL